MQELRPHLTRTPIAAVRQTLGLAADASDAFAVSGLSLDTRLVQEGDLFAALPGERTHGARFAAAAIDAGARAVLTDAAGASLIGDTQVPILVVEDPRARLGVLARLLYPGPRPTLIGVTGTNGKTTTTHCIEAAAVDAGIATAIVGTLGVRFGALHAYSGRTTPEAPSLHATLASFAESGAGLAAMEVSSHALALHRVDGLRFAVALFLGLSQDHLDFHPTMDDYFATKARLFTEDLADRAIVSVDDSWGRRLVEQTSLPVTTFSTTDSADWTASAIHSDAAGHTRFTAHRHDIEVPVHLPMPGGFNVSNALAALAALHAIGVDPRDAAPGLAEVRVPGRFEFVPNERGIAAYVDYAHTPDAVERVLAVARAATRGRLITVLGCGGDRDPAKRPLMGAAAARISDVVFVTDDNPRSEDPAAIRSQMLAGAPGSPHVREVGDRADAIRQAVAAATLGDCVMVLGKGHETGQEIAGVVHPFDDREELGRALDVSA